MNVPCRNPWIEPIERNLSSSSRAARGRLGFFLVAFVFAATACAAPEREVSSTVPSGKVTCDEVVATILPEDMDLVDRSLVPYSRTLLGIEAEYKGAGRNLSLVSGGYLDDIMEGYDDLLPAGSRDLLGGRARLLSGAYLDRSVRAALVTETDAIVPCGTRAIIGVGFTREEFETVLSGLTIRSREAG